MKSRRERLRDKTSEGTSNRMERDRARKSIKIYSKCDFDRILDIGCGSGELTVKLGQVCEATELYGLDIDKDSVSSARSLGVEARQFDISKEDLPYESDYFDSIYSGAVLDYVDEPKRFFSEIRRCLAPNGILVISSVNLASIHNRIALLFGKLPFPLSPDNDPTVTEEDGRLSGLSNRRTLYTHTRLLEVLNEHGFKVLGTQGAHSYRSMVSVVVRIFENSISRFPSLSYRSIIVCRKPAE